MAKPKTRGGSAAKRREQQRQQRQDRMSSAQSQTAKRTGGVSNPFKLPPGSPPLLTGPNGKPEVFFYGAEWCPLCAAERWSIITALSRFGTFHNLKEIASSSTDSYPNTSTFTFYQSSYTSSYIDFVPVDKWYNH